MPKLKLSENSLFYSTKVCHPMATIHHPSLTPWGHRKLDSVCNMTGLQVSEQNSCVPKDLFSRQNVSGTLYHSSQDTVMNEFNYTVLQLIKQILALMREKVNSMNKLSHS